AAVPTARSASALGMSCLARVFTSAACFSGSDGLSAAATARENSSSIRQSTGRAGSAGGGGGARAASQRSEATARKHQSQSGLPDSTCTPQYTPISLPHRVMRPLVSCWSPPDPPGELVHTESNIAPEGCGLCEL